MAGFTPANAARVLAETQGYEAGLRRRTEGITWMIWGIAAPGVFVSYALAGALAAGWTWLFAVLWAPWIAAGVLTTLTLWRSAALTAPSLADAGAGRRYGLAWAGATALVWLLFALLDGGDRIAVREPVYWLLAIGSLYVVFGALRLARPTPEGRRVTVAVGAAMVATAVALAFSTAGFPLVAGYMTDSVVAALASAAFPMIGGASLALRG